MIAKRLPNKSFRSTRRGFTLLEILVVVGIIVILAGVGGMYFVARYDEAKEKAAKAQVMEISGALGQYKLNNGDYPASLDALTGAQPNGDKPIMKPDALIDPWEHPYNYDPAGSHNNGMEPDVWANGPKGPIGNWSRR
jgi:general secretion pathway protein G